VADSSGDNLGSRLSTHPHPKGFDYLRILLATAVVFIHSKTFTLGPSDGDTLAAIAKAGVSSNAFNIASPPIYQPLIWVVLPSFFALSGFLVSGSLHRSRTTVGFLMLRGLRIFPALGVESLFAMLVLGPLVTVLPLAEYFRDPLFWEYPLNIIGDIHYFLPGVFTTNPVPRTVNQQLWTIPAEMHCYIFLAALLVLQIARYRLTVPIITLAVLGYYSALMIFGIYSPAAWSEGPGRVQTETLVISFMAGVCFFELRGKVPLRLDLFALSVVLSYGLLWGGMMQYFATIPIAYATIYAGTRNVFFPFVGNIADYSYGVYLYGLPIQQLVVYMFPANKNWMLSFCITMAITLLFAALSWHFVESKIMRRKKVLVDRAEAIVRPFSIRLPWAPENTTTQERATQRSKASA
jgi:peptidoglycan/LPS O-acetylase OafA/YrhL